MAVAINHCVVGEALIDPHAPHTDRSTLAEPLFALDATQTQKQERNLVAWALGGTFDDDTPILVDAEQPSRHLTKRKTVDLVTRLAGSFKPGMTVCVHSPNDVLYPVLVLAILASACTWTGTNPASTSTELQHHLTASKAAYVITIPEHLETVKAAVDACAGKIEILIWTDILSEGKNGERIMNGYKTLHDLLQGPQTQSLEARLDGVTKTSPATIFATSGTTGLPKMIQRTHDELILESKATKDSPKPYPVRRLYCTPMFHAYSFIDMTINTIRLGLPSFYMRRYTKLFAQKVRQFSASETLLVPPVLMLLSSQSAADPEERKNIQSLRTIICAGAPLSPQLRSEFTDLFDFPVRLVQGWGMSEGGWFTTFQYPECDDTGSVGRPVQGYEIRTSGLNPMIIDENRLASELLVRAPQMPRSYLDNPSATAEAFTKDGWLKTGDIGYIEDGKIYLVDRAKDMIKVNGWSVAPAELEAALYKHPRVIDAAVVGHGVGIDEHPVIFIVSKEDDLSPADVIAHLMQFVARFKVAKSEVKFVDSIPRNPSGKILRKILRQQLT